MSTSRMNPVALRALLLLAIIGAAAVMAYGVYAVFVQAPILLLLGGWLGLRRRGVRFPNGGWIHGTAAFGSLVYLAKRGWLGPDGMLVGKADAPSMLVAAKWLGTAPLAMSAEANTLFLAARAKKGVWVRAPNLIHTAIIGRPGSSKTTGFVTTNALASLGRDSTIFLDIKGEIFRATAEHLRKHGSTIVLLDPFHVVSTRPDTLNPFSVLDRRSPNIVPETMAYGEALAMPEPNAHDPHWSQSAAQVIQGVVLHMLAEAPRKLRNPGVMSQILSNDEELTGAIARMVKNPAWGGALKKIGGRMAFYQDREKASVLTTIGRSIRVFDSAPVLAATSSTSFAVGDIKAKPTTVYIVIPPNLVTACAGLIRVWLNVFFSECAKGPPDEGRKIRFVLDEYGSIGQSFACVENAISQLRGYGVRVCLILHALSQLEKCFPNNQSKTVLASLTQIYLGANDTQTAEDIVKRLGSQTVQAWTLNGGENRGESREAGRPANTSTGKNSGFNVQEAARPLLTIDEVMRLPEQTAIVFPPAAAPVLVRVVRHFDKEFQELVPAAAPNSKPETKPARRQHPAVAALIILAGLLIAGLLTSKPRPTIPTVPYRESR